MKTKPILTWINQNPSAFKSFLSTIVALVGALVLAITGKALNIGPWDDVLNLFVAVIATGIAIVGLGDGINHHLRGPLPKPSDEAAALVASIKSQPVSEAVSELKEATQEIVEAEDSPEGAPGVKEQK